MITDLTCNNVIVTVFPALVDHTAQLFFRQKAVYSIANFNPSTNFPSIENILSEF